MEHHDGDGANARVHVYLPIRFNTPMRIPVRHKLNLL
jgi:hypothetical protein